MGLHQEMTVDVEQCENLQVEILPANVIPQKYVHKVVQNFMKCVATLIQHVENAVSYSNGKIFTNSHTVSKDGIDFEEHSIKQEPNDNKIHLKNVKKCILQLCLVCIDKNIFIECDIKFTEIAFYSCLDEYTRSLVLDYLTENISYLINYVSNIKELFNEQKGKKEAKIISKSLLKLFKQILLIPLNSNLDNSSASKTANASIWYEEAKQNLTEKLILLRTALIKLKKIFKKNIPNPDPITIEDTDTSESGKRKANKSEDTQVKKKRKLDGKSSQVVQVEASENASLKTKKRSKTNTNKENSSDGEVVTELLFDESEDKKTHSETKNNTSISESSDLNIENLFTTELSICDGDVTLPPCHDKHLDTDGKVLTLQQLTQNLRANRECVLKNHKSADEDGTDMHEILVAFNSGDYEAEIVDEHERYERIIQQYDLNANERFVVLQGMLNDLKKAQELSAEMKEKLRNLHVKINFEIPESHKIESSIAGGPTPKETKALQAFNLSCKRFNKAEDETIKRNWAEFCKVHNLDENPKPFIKFNHGHHGFLMCEDRRKFGQFLAKDLPNRSLCSVYKRFKSLFKTCNKTGRYTLEEDTLILIYCSRMPGFTQHFAEIAELLRRPRASVEQRYRVLTSPYNERVKWTLDIENQIVTSLLKIVGSKNIQSLAKTTFSRDQFKKIEKIVQIDYKKIYIHYYKFMYSKLFSPIPLNNSEFRCKLVDILEETGETDWNNLDWKEISKQFEGVHPSFLIGQLTCARHKVVPKKYHSDLPTVLKYMRQHIQERRAAGIVPFTNRTIKRYCWTDKGLQTID